MKSKGDFDGNTEESIRVHIFLLKKCLESSQNIITTSLDAT